MAAVLLRAAPPAASTRPARTTMVPCGPAGTKGAARRQLRASPLSATKLRSQPSTDVLTATASAAASALLAKAAAIMAASAHHPAFLLTTALQHTAVKPTEAVAEREATASAKIAVARAPSPANVITSPLPTHWPVVSSVAEWASAQKQAVAAGAVMATVFLSDKALAAHGPLLERLRAAHGDGPHGVRFAFVHVGADFLRRAAAAAVEPVAVAAGAIPRGAQLLQTDRLSYLAALHGTDVALAAVLLPNGQRAALPALFITAAPPHDHGPARCAVATRVADMPQLLADWAFVNHVVAQRRAAGVAAASTTFYGTASNVTSFTVRSGRTPASGSMSSGEYAGFAGAWAGSGRYAQRPLESGEWAAPVCLPAYHSSSKP